MGNSDGGGCVGLVIIIGVVAYIIELLVKLLSKVFVAAISIVGILLLAMCLVGAVIGVFYAFKSFFAAVMEVSDDRKALFSKPQYTRLTLPRTADGKFEFYEDISRASYFNGGMLKDIGSILKKTFSNSVKRLRIFGSNISDSSGLFGKTFSIIKNVFSIISLLVFGMVVSAVLSVMIVVSSVIILIFYRIFFFAVLSAEKASFSAKKITNRCDFCKAEYDLPVYFCPKCGIPHRYLRPSKFGIFYRTCVCLEKLPVTAGGKCADGKKRSQLTAACPKCGKSDRSSETRPLGIPLIGGVNAGKTTFKTAFLYSFLNDEATKLGLTIKLNDKAMENEFEEIRSCFIGKRMVTETRPGKEYDVTSFNFVIEHEKLSVPRLMHIYDMPGEVFEQSNAQESLKHFTFSEGVIFVIDPYTLQSIISSESDLGGMRVGKMDFNTLVEVFCETLEKLPNMPREGKKYAIPVAICINKVDTPSLRNRIGMPAARKLMNAKPEVYSDSYDTMDMLCREFLSANGKSNAVTLLDQNFKYVHFFACSATGSIPKGPVRFVPEQVLAAVYWITARSDSQLAPLLGTDVPHDIDESTRKRLSQNRSDYFEIIENSLVH
ncbi:hypothetical protein SAMN02910447_00929 [Ruminococcus sp. YE71]|uniref:TRAFAC clade GTPase domain-containing protein n=1 Tax=unclassified Ruminococcus TaxID=2608920 RepID=UPI00088895E5|nr:MULTISPECIES: hypothetical protein [unclassified Ruminococcus]SDA15438.1 hypothetical protein SAMN02910446_00928 [Ruminococcus sp. YE78]SFW22545.1 hypothetical protein SAMN02910447_00929 [Ruminococcus sp. YE71]